MGAKNPEPRDVLYRIKRGLAGYVSYLAACEMNQAFSEYVLYEPILRILMARGFTVECEYECPGVAQPAKGDKKRIDFRATGQHLELAIEVKWTKATKPKLDSDLAKLHGFAAARPASVPLLVLFGRESHLTKFASPDDALKERGDAVIAQLGRTRYGCRIFELKTE
ncbi:MAG: hypothetical protein K8R60_06485 [Burkholderiales bacterium]|nr:hypothetical protein [Burkholderiales bacterium]